MISEDVEAVGEEAASAGVLHVYAEGKYIDR